MPVLENPRHEAFAQHRAKGALLDDAYEAAGFAPARGHPSRLARRPEVAERIAELRALAAPVAEVTPHALFDALLRFATSSEVLASGGGIKEARLAILDAVRLQEGLVKARNDDREKVIYG